MGPRLPYPGLRPFGADESHLFFGREQHTDELLSRLGRARFLAVVGASGCGKSSLVRAGMIAGLETGFMASTGSRWRLATLRPGSHPLKRLATALTEEPALGPELAGEAHAAALVHATLVRGSLGLVEVLQETPLDDQENLLVLVDQFEELFRYQEGRVSDEAEAFVALLLESAAQKELPIHVVITMRSDSLGDCARFMGLPEAMNDSQYLTPRLTRDQRRAAIVGPARVFGGDVEPALVNRILNDMGSDPDQLPLMQHVLMRMWIQAGGVGGSASGASALDRARPRTLTLQAYEAAGGLQTALSSHADEAFNELDTAQQAIAEVMFRALSERGRQQRDIRRPATVTEVSAVARVTEEEVIRVAEAFRRPDRSFITPSVGEPLYPNTMLDISHESLIRYWQLFARWVEAEANAVWLFGRLREQANLWAKGEGALWKTPDLENGLAWKETPPKPTRPWAERYGGDFDLAMKFLEESEVEKRSEETAKRREQRTRKELRLTRLAAALFVGFMLAATTAARMWYSDSQRGRRALADVNFDKTLSLLADRTADALPRLALALRSDHDDLRTQDLLLDVLTRKSWPLPVAVVPQGHGLRSVAFSRDGRGILTAYDDGTVRVWDTAARAKWRPIGQPLPHHGPIRSAALSPDGQRVVTVAGDKTAQVWNAATGQMIGRPLRHRGPVNSSMFSADGRWVVTSSRDSTARVWDAATGHPIGRPLRHGGAVDLAVFAPDARRVLTASHDDTARVWDAGAGQPIGPPMEQYGRLMAAAFSRDGRQVIGAFEDKPVGAWSVADGGASRRASYEGTVLAATFSPDGRWVVTVLADSTVRVWDAATGRPTVEPLRHGGNVSSAAVSSDGRWVVIASADSTVRVWDVATGQATAQPLRHGGEVYSAAFSSDGRWVVTASADGTASVWDAAVGESRGETLRHGDAVRSAAFSPDGQKVVTASADRTARVWDAVTGRALGESLRHDGAVRSAAFSSDGRRVLTASADGARIWDAATGRLVGEPLRHRDQVYDATFSPDGQRLITASGDYTAQVWDAATGRQSGTPLQHNGEVYSAGFSADGHWIITASADGAARVWDATTGLVVGAPLRHQQAVRSAVFSPDGQSVLTVSDDGAARIWNRATGQPRTDPLKHGALRVVSAAFSPDGRRVVTASDDGTARVWIMGTGRRIGQVSHGLTVNSAVFSPDGQRIVTASADRTARAWDVLTGKSGDAKSLALVAEALSGYRVNAEGAVVAVRDPVGALARLRDDADDESFIRWFLADRCTRSISPLSTITVPEYLQRAGTRADAVLASSCAAAPGQFH